MKSRNLILGIFILFIGVVSLLASLDVIYLSWRIVWRLWPMLFIFTGVAILPIKDWLKATLLVITLAASVLLYRYEDGKSDDGWFHFTQNAASPKVEMPVA